MNTSQMMADGGWRSPQAANRYIKLSAQDAGRFFAQTEETDGVLASDV